MDKGVPSLFSSDTRECFPTKKKPSARPILDTVVVVVCCLLQWYRTVACCLFLFVLSSSLLHYPIRRVWVCLLGHSLTIHGFCSCDILGTLCCCDRPTDSVTISRWCMVCVCVFLWHKSCRRRRRRWRWCWCWCWFSDYRLPNLCRRGCCYLLVLYSIIEHWNQNTCQKERYCCHTRCLHSHHIVLDVFVLLAPTTTITIYYGDDNDQDNINENNVPTNQW